MKPPGLPSPEARTTSAPTNGGTTTAKRNGSRRPPASRNSPGMTSSIAVSRMAWIPVRFRNIPSSRSPPGQAADPELAEEGLGGHVADRHPLLEPVLAQLVGDVEHELVGGPEAPGALSGDDHHWSGIGQQPLPAFGGGQGTLQGGDGMG